MADQAEFDKFADDFAYRAMRTDNISASGESPDFFDEYKIKDAALQMQAAIGEPGGNGAHCPPSSSRTL